MGKTVQTVYWDLVGYVYPGEPDKVNGTWMSITAPLNPTCELELHRALVSSCSSAVDLGSSYALQFHQVVVNLCGLGLSLNHGLIPLAKMACRSVTQSEGLLV